jgi:hypothetical protein
MSTSGSPISEPKSSEDPNMPPGTSSSTPRRPIYQTETTGNYWGDVREAFKVQYIITLRSPVLPLPVPFFFIALSVVLSRYKTQ